jgi:hypothetical protein
MKACIPISLVAIILSAASLIHSYRVSSLDQGQIQKAASEALRAREREFVEELKPRFQVIFSAEMGDELDKGWNPETVEQMIEPLTRIVNAMSKE